MFITLFLITYLSIKLKLTFKKMMDIKEIHTELNCSPFKLNS